MSYKEIKKTLIAGGIGAIVGGIVVAVATEAIPRMMEQISGTMMGMMMKRMQEGGCTPEET